MAQPGMERMGSLRSLGSFEENTNTIESTIGTSKHVRSRVTELGKVMATLPDLAAAASIQAELECVKPSLAKLAKSKTTDVKIRAGGEEHRLRDAQAALSSMCEQVAEATNQNWGKDKIPRKLELDPEASLLKLDKDLDLLRKSVLNHSPNERQSLFRDFVADNASRGPWHMALLAVVFFGAPSLMAIAHRIEVSCLSRGDRDISKANISPHNLFNTFEVLALGNSLVEILVAASPDKENLGVRFLIDTLIADARVLIEETSTSASTATEMSLAEMTEDSPTNKPRPPWREKLTKPPAPTFTSESSSSSASKPAAAPPPQSKPVASESSRAVPPPPPVDPASPSPWTKCESRSHKGKYYWFNTVTGKSQWKPPKELKEPKSPKSSKAESDKEEEPAVSKDKEGKLRANTPKRRVNDGEAAPSVIAIDNSAKRQGLSDPSKSKKQVGLTGKGVVLGSVRRSSINASTASGSDGRASEESNGSVDKASAPSAPPRQTNSTTGPMIARFSSRSSTTSASFSEGDGGKKRSVSPMIARRLAAWKNAAVAEVSEEEKEKEEKPAAKKFPSSGFASAVGAMKRSNSAPVRKLDSQEGSSPAAPSYVESLEAASTKKSVPARKLSASLRSASPIADRVNMWKKKAAENIPSVIPSAPKAKAVSEPAPKPEVKPVIAEKPVADRAPSPAPRSRERESSPAPRREPSPSRTRKIQKAVPTIPASKTSEHIAMPSDDAAATVKHTVRKPSPSRGQPPPNFGFGDSPSPLSSSAASSIGSGGTFSPKSGFSLSMVPPAPARLKTSESMKETSTTSSADVSNQSEGNEEERGRSGVPIRKASYRSSSPMAERLALWKSKTETSTAPGKMKRSSSAGAAVFGRRSGEGGTSSAIADRVNQWKRMASSDNTGENETKPKESTADAPPSQSSSTNEDAVKDSDPTATKPPERESTPTRSRGRNPSPIADRLRKWKAASHAVGVPAYLAQRTLASKNEGTSSSNAKPNSYVASLQNRSVNARAGSAPPRSPGNRPSNQAKDEEPSSSNGGTSQISSSSDNTSKTETTQASDAAKGGGENSNPIKDDSVKSNSSAPSNTDASRRFGRLSNTLTTSSSSNNSSSSTYAPSSGSMSSSKPRQQRSMSPLIAARMKAWQNKALGDE